MPASGVSPISDPELLAPVGGAGVQGTRSRSDAVREVLVTSGVAELMPIVATDSAAYELIG